MTLDRRSFLASAAGLAAVSCPAIARADPARSMTVTGVIEYGQSNSEAQAGSGAALLRTDYPGDGRLLMPRTDAANVWLGQATTGGRSFELPAGTVQGLMPLRGAMGSRTHGSTAGESMVLRLHEDEVRRGRFEETKILLFNAAEGGQTIRNLSSGPQPGFFAFENLKKTVEAVNKAITAENLRYAVRVLLTAQGESDAEDPLLGAKQEEVRLQVERAVQSITRQSEPIWMLSVQPSSFTDAGAGVRSILQQHERTIRSTGWFYCLGPTYNFPFAADFLHSTTIGHDERGELYAVAFEALRDKGRWDVLRALCATRAGHDRIRIALSEPAVRDDGGSVAAIAHAGVSLVEGDVRSVVIEGNTVIVRTQGPAATVKAVRFGMDGHRHKPRTAGTIPRTNIRSAARYGTYRSGEDMVKWLCHQEIEVRA